MSRFAQIISVTPNLVDVRDTHTFKIDWTPPTDPPRPVTYLRLYRFIGAYDHCVDIETVEVPVEGSTGMNYDPKLIAEFRYVYNANNILTDITRRVVHPNNPGTHLSTNTLNEPTFFDDNMSQYYNRSSSRLLQYHGILDANNDQQLLNQIYTTRRTIYYFLVTYLQGVDSAAPYCVATHMNSQVVDCFSTRTQVRHDVLHYEMDLCWDTYPYPQESKAAGAPGDNFGISRSAVDINRIFLDAAQRGPTGRGGNAWVSNRNANGHVYRFNLSNGLQTGFSFNEINNPGSRRMRGHGITVDINTGDLISSYGFDASSSNHSNIRRIYNTTRDNDTETTQLQRTTIRTSNNNFYGMTNIQGTPHLLFALSRYVGHQVLINTLSNAHKNVTALSSGHDYYGCTSLPNGAIALGEWPGSNIDILIPNWNSSSGGTVVTLNGVGNGVGMTSVMLNGELFIIHTDGGHQVHATKINPSTNQHIESLGRISNGNFRGVGIDSDNNIIGVGYPHGTEDGIGKIYFNKDIPDDYAYDSVRLQDWPFSFVNTRHIEWFLTRDHHKMDDNAVLFFNDGYYTAKGAWLSLVSDNRYESEYNAGNNTYTLRRNRNRGWKPNRTVNTYNFGIRINPAHKDNIIRLIVEWDRTYGTNEANIQGRLILPNKGRTHNTGFRTSVVNGTDIITYSPGRLVTREGFRSIILRNHNGNSYQYSDFTGSQFIASAIDSIYNYSIGAPKPVEPYFFSTMLSAATGYQYKEELEDCYPWPFLEVMETAAPTTTTTTTTTTPAPTTTTTTNEVTPIPEGIWFANEAGIQGIHPADYDISEAPVGSNIWFRFDAYGNPDKYIIEYPIGTIILDTAWVGNSNTVDLNPGDFPAPDWWTLPTRPSWWRSDANWPPNITPAGWSGYGPPGPIDTSSTVYWDWAKLPPPWGTHNPGLWNNTQNYSSNQYVRWTSSHGPYHLAPDGFNSRIWRSLQNNNQGKEPGIPGNENWWELVVLPAFTKIAGQDSFRITVYAPGSGTEWRYRLAWSQPGNPPPPNPTEGT